MSAYHCPLTELVVGRPQACLDRTRRLQHAARAASLAESGWHWTDLKTAAVRGGNATSARRRWSRPGAPSPPTWQA